MYVTIQGRKHLRRLVDSKEGLVQSIDELLELLTGVIVGVFHIIPLLYVFLPKIPSPDQNVRQSYCRRNLVFPQGLTIFCHKLILWCFSFHLRVNNRCTPLSEDSRYRLHLFYCVFLKDILG